MNKPYLLIDLDGVILDWVSAFRFWLKEKGIKTSSIEPKNWELDNYVPGHNVNELIKEFNYSKNFEEIPAFSDAKLYLKKLAKTHIIIAVTSGGSTIFHRFSREKNLSKEFENIPIHLICLDLHESKKQILNMFPKGSIWVEDRPQNVELGAEVGHISILIERSYNKDYHNHKVVKLNSWHEIYEFLS